jgi:HSP20 family molecular chaperone IbpA
VRSLRGSAVPADILIESETPEASDAAPAVKQELRAADGRFEIDVGPGRYRVTIAAPGYKTQTRQVDVEENGVTVLNVDLRTER